MTTTTQQIVEHQVYLLGKGDECFTVNAPIGSTFIDVIEEVTDETLLEILRVCRRMGEGYPLISIWYTNPVDGRRTELVESAMEL